MKFPKLQHGDRVEITWLDIVGDCIGDPNEAETAYCRTMGYFHGWKGRGRNRAIVLCLTGFPREANACRGYDTYPYGVIEHIEVWSRNEQASNNDVQDADGVVEP